MGIAWRIDPAAAARILDFIAPVIALELALCCWALGGLGGIFGARLLPAPPAATPPRRRVLR